MVTVLELFHMVGLLGIHIPGVSLYTLISSFYEDTGLIAVGPTLTALF